MMLPLNLCCKLTICKSQNRSIKFKVVDELGRSETYNGLIYSEFSSSANFFDFGLRNGITSNRLVNSVFFKDLIKVEDRIIYQLINFERKKLTCLVR